eukprot:2557012-Alexandrium_andersonii.AAC.1
MKPVIDEIKPSCTILNGGRLAVPGLGLCWVYRTLLHVLRCCAPYPSGSCRSVLFACRQFLSVPRRRRRGPSVSQL